MERICVAIRVRPSISDESSTGLHWKVEDNRISLHKRLGTPVSGVSHAFDHIFDESCANSEVYERLTKDIVHAAVEGFNGTVFAYGQTSSGKTFTMNGSQTDPGVIHQAVRDIFSKIQEATDREFLVRVSYMEIYNEEINDLFAVENKKLQIHESLERGVYVSGLREEIVSSGEQVLQLIESGEVNRHFGETNMNVRSSRSHTIFRMVIESKGKYDNHRDEYFSGDAVRVSVLNLVDLAGSERIAKTGAAGVRLKEGKHINKSLMVLGNVINKLSDGVKQRGHIPYRDSKLTRILQPALGGNAKTSIICTIAPEEVHVEETKGTLQFASRAKRITNCAQVNEILTDAALLKRQKLEIEELRKKLQGSRAEVLEQEILKLRNDMLKYELEREKLATELEEERKSHKEHQLKLGNLSSQVISDCDRSSTQEHESSKQHHNEESSVNHKKFEEEAFRTPCFKAAPSAFVARRGIYSKLPDFSPLPNAFSTVADEDTWQRLNKGYIADLDSLQVTPARRVQSFPCGDVTPVSSHRTDTSEIEHLKRQLELAIAEKEEIQKEFSLLKAEKDTLHRMASESSQELSKVVDQKDKAVKELITETQRRQELEKEIKQFSVAFASRQRSLLSFHTDFKSKIESLKAQNSVLVPKSYGYGIKDLPG
uniref:Kinesin-like protein n=1 Tax=Kalanchoe fedtschenkoi TaxID=63787 RepID=A0A7N1A5D7_KALFE